MVFVPSHIPAFGYIDPGTGYTITTFSGLLVIMLSGFLGFFLLFFKRVWKFFRKHRASIIMVLLLLAIAAGAYVMWFGSRTSPFAHKIIIVGFDALSPQVIEPLMDRGRLPNFSRLAGMGSYRHLQTTNPPQSPVAWSGFSTGQNPGKNGVFDFIVRDPKTYGLRLSLANTETGRALPVIKTPRFWQYTSQKKVPTVILGCPVTFPPDKVHGRMISGMGVPDILGTEGTFTFYTTEPENDDETPGGKVFHVSRKPTMILHLIGPKVAGAGGAGENVKVPFRLTLVPGGIEIEHQGQKTQLKTGRWSDWQEVAFDLGPLRSMKGIFKFYLVEREPELKLYITPINFDPRSPFFPITYPSGYGRELAQALGLFHTQGIPFDTWALNEDRITEDIFLENVEQVLAEKEALLDFELKRFEKGVFYIYFESPDIIQHMFWRHLDPQHPMHDPASAAKYRTIIEDWYVRMDQVLGRVMDQARKDDVLIVLSDHGMNTFRRAVHLNSWLRDNGYLELKDPVAMSGEPLLKGIDWSRTKAYAIGFGAIYINEKGREAQGIVAPGTEKEMLKNDLIEGLKRFVDKKTNAFVVSKVYKQEEIFWGDSQKDAPDLVVGFNTGYRASWQTALGDVPQGLLEDNLKKWAGDHIFDPALVPGVIFSNRAITRPDPTILDVAPTVLRLVGYTDEEVKSFDLDGRPLFE